MTPDDALSGTSAKDSDGASPNENFAASRSVTTPAAANSDPNIPKMAHNFLFGVTGRNSRLACCTTRTLLMSLLDNSSAKRACSKRTNWSRYWVSSICTSRSIAAMSISFLFNSRNSFRNRSIVVSNEATSARRANTLPVSNAICSPSVTCSGLMPCLMSSVSGRCRS